MFNTKIPPFCDTCLPVRVCLFRFLHPTILKAFSVKMHSKRPRKYIKNQKNLCKQNVIFITCYRPKNIPLVLHFYIDLRLTDTQTGEMCDLEINIKIYSIKKARHKPRLKNYFTPFTTPGGGSAAHDRLRGSR